MSEIKIIILAGQGESTTLMINGIKNYFSIVKVVIEKPVSRSFLLKARVNKFGLLKVLGQILFMTYNKVWLRRNSKKRIEEIKISESLDDESISELDIVRVSSINSKEVESILKAHQPNVVVVNGTRIIKKEIIASIDAPFINTHVGITPKYRGVHGGYWALTENDFKNCGSTIHLIDKGIDTGGILYQGIISTTDKDTFNTYPYLQIAVAIPLMRKAIIDIANKKYKIRSVGLPSKLWSHPTLIEYLKYRLFQGVK